jgi:uncharacterized protein YgiB involved in biofilm formation
MRIRQKELNQRRQRKQKIAKLRAKYGTATTQAEKQHLVEKLRQVSFYASMDKTATLTAQPKPVATARATATTTAATKPPRRIIRTEQ